MRQHTCWVHGNNKKQGGWMYQKKNENEKWKSCVMIKRWDNRHNVAKIKSKIVLSACIQIPLSCVCWQKYSVQKNPLKSVLNVHNSDDFAQLCAKIGSTN